LKITHWTQRTMNAHGLILTASQVADLCPLHQLEELHCACEADAMVRLLQPLENGMQLQWQTLPFHCHITDAVGALFSSLSHVHTFNDKELESGLSSPDCLALLPSLTNVTLGYVTDHVLALSQALPRVTTLTLICIDATTLELQALLMHFPCVSSLTLNSVKEFDALTFLQPLRATLRELTLDYCGVYDCSPESVLQLDDFQLHSLRLSEAFNAPMSAELIASLRVPSTLIPTLHTFERR